MNLGTELKEKYNQCVCGLQRKKCFKPNGLGFGKAVIPCPECGAVSFRKVNDKRKGTYYGH